MVDLQVPETVKGFFIYLWKILDKSSMYQEDLVNFAVYDLGINDKKKINEFIEKGIKTGLLMGGSSVDDEEDGGGLTLAIGLMNSLAKWQDGAFPRVAIIEQRLRDLETRGVELVSAPAGVAARGAPVGESGPGAVAVSTVSTAGSKQSGTVPGAAPVESSGQLPGAPGVPTAEIPGMHWDRPSRVTQKVLVDTFGQEFLDLIGKLALENPVRRGLRIKCDDVYWEHYNISEGLVRAFVTGSAPEPYEVTIKVDARELVHDCDDFRRNQARRKMLCKHVVKVLSLLRLYNEQGTLELMRDMLEHRDEWKYIVG